jgi:hypothetical protein
MHITEKHGDADVVVKKSKRDVQFKDTPKNSGLPLSSNIMLVVGRMGDGKSMFVEGLFKKHWKKLFHKVFLVCPEMSRSSYPNSYTQKIHPSRMHSELTPDVLQKITAEISDASAEVDDDEELKPEHYCLVLDDVQSSMKNAETARALRMLFSTHRHYSAGLTIICCLQNLMAMPKDCRDLSSHLVQFSGLSVGWQNVERINMEFLPYLRRHEIIELFKYIYDKPHTFSIISKRGGITKNFNPLKVTTDELDIRHD